MPVRHVYDIVKSKRKLHPHDYEITLEDGTIINLPGSAFPDFNAIEAGDRVLIDLANEEMSSAAMVFVFRRQYPVRHFGVNRDYVEVVEPD